MQRAADTGGHMTHLFTCIGRAAAPFTVHASVQHDFGSKGSNDDGFLGL